MLSFECPHFRNCLAPNQSKRRLDTKQQSSLEEHGDMESEDVVDTGQTDEDKRRVRRTLRDLHGKLLLCKDGSIEGEDLSSILPTRFSKMSRELKKLWRMPRCSGCFAKR